MARNSNTPSLENLNGSGYSAHSTRTRLSLVPTRNGRPRATAPVYSSLNRNHSYPGPIVSEYHYGDNSAVGHSMYYSNRTPASSLQEVSSPSYTTPRPSRSQTYLFPTANYPAETYDRELDLEDELNGSNVSLTPQSQNQAFFEQQPAEQSHQYTWDPAYPLSNNGTWPESTFWSSQASADDYDDDQYSVEQSSTPPQQETYLSRPHSPTTQRYLQEDSPHDRLRLGLPRYETQEERLRAYEPVARYDASSSHGGSRGTTRRHQAPN